MYTQIVCPRCQTRYTAEVHQVIDVGQNPELKYALLNGQLNLAVCPNCGAGGQLSTSLLYHDPEHQLFMAYFPPELNLSQMQREQHLGQLTRQVIDALPAEKRRGYLFQPQLMLTMQSFMENVLETEGITKEMIERQRRQAELLQTLARADKDVVDYLIKERQDEIDETFFAMLQSYIDAASQTDNNAQLLPLLNLRARLMTDTPVGRKLEQQQVALHALSREAKKQGGLTPALLLKHVVANQEDEAIVEGLILAGRSAMNYDFFRLLTEEIEKQAAAGNKTSAARLTELRGHLLKIQETLQQQSQRLLEKANQTLQTILDAPDQEVAILEHSDQIDDAFMYLLSARIAQAEQRGQTAELQALSQVHARIMQQMESQMPPEIVLLNELIEAETEAEQQQLLEENRELVSTELLKMIEAVTKQVQETGQAELNGRLQQVSDLIKARL